MKMHFAFPTVLVVATIIVSGIVSAEEKQQQPDRKNMIGTWRGGFPDDKTPVYELIITEEKISGTNLKDGKSLGEGSWILDVEKHTIDATMTTPPHKGALFQGIYALDGDNLKWVSDNGSRGKRPAALVHKPGQSFLMILTRQPEKKKA